MRNCTYTFYFKGSILPVHNKVISGFQASVRLWCRWRAQTRNRRAVVAGKLELRGPEDNAQLVGEETVFVCELADTNSTTGTVTQPYTITWTFIPHNMDAVSTVMTATHQGQQRFINLTPNPKKYNDTGSPHLRVHDVLLSDAGVYRCQSNLTGDTATAQLYVVGFPKCHNNKPEVYYNQNISLDCLVQYGGNRHPTVNWKFGETVLNSTSETQDNSTLLHERLVLEANDNIRGRIYHCQVYYPGLKSVECLALPAIQVYTSHPYLMPSTPSPLPHCPNHILHSQVSYVDIVFKREVLGQ
ncbi:tyrosine kinase receptor cad96ca [Plakobranchus ocellatus]|uniref:Tyrosine kinase receptor cad96ca n=1 Tax=Plakobranchus ocellatus TaxID=259542 RepID=A0AAV3YUC7_9GAST|nr:tyrosine kinase receptor cad96ca [Plakobranchus ocellatus]